MVDVSNERKTAQSVAPINQAILESVLQAYGCLKRNAAKSLPLIPHASQIDRPEFAHHSFPRRVYVSSQRFPGPKSILVTPLDSFLDPPAACKNIDYCFYGGELIAPRRAENYISAHISVSTQYSRSHEYEDILQTPVSRKFPLLYHQTRQTGSSVPPKKAPARQTNPKVGYHRQTEQPTVKEEPEEISRIGDLDVSESSGLTSVLPRSLPSSARTPSIPCSQKEAETSQMKRIDSHRGSADVGVNSARRESRQDSERTMVAEADDRVYNSPTMYQVTKVPAQYAIDYLQDSPGARNEEIPEVKDVRPNHGQVEKEGPPNRWREDAASTISKRATSVDELRRRFEESCTVILPKGSKRPNNCVEDQEEEQNRARTMVRTGAAKPVQSENPRSPPFARRVAGTQTDDNPRPVAIRPSRLFRRSDEELKGERVGRRYNPSPTQRRLPGENGRYLSPRSINRAANDTLWPDGVYFKAGDVYKRVETNTYANGTSVRYFLPRSEAEPVAVFGTDADYEPRTSFRTAARRRDFSRERLEAEDRPYRTAALSRSSSSLSLPRSPVRPKVKQMKSEIGAGYFRADTPSSHKRHNLTVDCSDQYDSRRRFGQTSPILQKQNFSYRGSLPCVSGSRGTARCWRGRPSPTLNYSYLEHMEPSTMPYRSNTLSSWSDLRTTRESQLYATLPMRKSRSQQHLSPHVSRSAAAAAAVRHRFPKAGEIRDQVMHGAPVHALKWKRPWVSVNNAKVSTNLPPVCSASPPRAQTSFSPRPRDQFRRSGGGCVDQASISQEFGSNIAFFEQMARENMNEPHCSFGSDCYHCSFRDRLGALRSASPSPSRTRVRPYFGSLRRQNMSSFQCRREVGDGGRPRVEVINSPGKLHSQVECISPKPRPGNSFSQTNPVRCSVRRLGDIYDTS
ncbi:unnamed protein product [Dibothriocephalus latus]|uniref:Uncharacterized protein n=1 Tax=Dibothriocephalus latus TaxID=60516 RepID=A0A3P6UF15_DIBLA|nr:unnamed protein product [Dibothriocephalus latus]